jgi:intracellular sulfur oxidation DsrE/DsrF family protein
MKNLRLSAGLAIAMLLALAGFHGPAFADAKHKLVIQVSTDDVRTQNIALNNATNLQKALGDDIEIEIVAYGPGLSMLTPKSPASKRVPNLAVYENITFSACGNTMKKVAKKSGKDVTLVEGVKVVPAGVVRIMELQEQGWTYVRP